jgi:cytochrome c553
LKARHTFMTAITGTAAGKWAATIGSLLIAGRVTARTVAAASVFLVLHATSALADPRPPVEASQCTACHGLHGQGAPGGVPRLAGQNADYLSHALSMFKAGTRASPIMQPIARNLGDTQIRHLADYFHNLSAPHVDMTASGSLQGKGNGARFPRIAAEPAQFVSNRLHEFQARAQAATPAPGTMTAVAAKLDESQIAAAAAYLSQLEP